MFVKTWAKQKLVTEIQIFLGFANFYYCFISGFYKIAAPLTFMFKIANIKNTASKVLESNNKVGSKKIGVGNICVKKSKNLIKSKILSTSKKSDFVEVHFFKTDFSTFKVKKTFAYLQKSFTKALILYYFNQKRYIWIELDAFS